MKLQMIGCSHHDAAVEFREKISFTTEQVAETLRAFRREFPSGELVVLNTCNRVELYASSGEDQEFGPHEFAQFLADRHQLPAIEIADQMIWRGGREAVEHLFSVAASLDSMVVGEAQILSQVKQAYDLACSTDSAGPLTHAVFQAAMRAAKRIQQETSIHRRRVSIPSVAVGEVASQVFDSLQGKRVVLCGAGEMGEETLRYLRQAGADEIHILNRSYERAVDLSAAFQAEPVRWDTLASEVVEADLLIGTTAATEPILDLAAFAPLHSRRQERVLLILDLAVPRDFDPAIGALSGVYLYSIDDLQSACDRNRRERQKELPKAQQIIAEESQRFIQASGHRATGPVIAQLRKQAQQLKEDELARLMNKLPLSELDPAAHREIEKSFDRLINKLLHPPLASLRDDAAEGHRRGLVDALRHLFNLGDD